MQKKPTAKPKPQRQNRLQTIITSLVLLALASITTFAGCQNPPSGTAPLKPGETAPNYNSAGIDTQRSPRDLSTELEAWRLNNGLPAVAAAVCDLDGLLASGATGYRKLNDKTRVTIDDKFHIGSCTKSMTSTLAGRLVDAGFISWQTTVAKTFPGYAADISPRLGPTTLRMLLAHRSGQTTQAGNDLILKVASTGKPAPEQTAMLLKSVLALEPKDEPGTQFHYSNIGYFLAGLMLQASAGQTWEHLMREEIFDPLGLESAGFGPPASPSKTDQPWSHNFTNGSFVPVPPGPDADNPRVIGPAGTVHMNVTDFSSYAQFHLTNLKGQYELLSKSSAQMIYTPHPGPPPSGMQIPGIKPGTQPGYALGFVRIDHEILGPVWLHTGSNNMNLAVFVIAPEKNVAVVMMTNATKPGLDVNMVKQALDMAVSYGK